MKALEGEYISFSRLRGIQSIERKKIHVPVLFKELDVAVSDFTTVIAALDFADPASMLGWAGIDEKPRSPLTELNPSFVNIRMLKVDPQYFGLGIGKRLLAYAREAIHQRGKIAVLKPQRPGEGIDKRIRETAYPMSTEQLREFYLRHGFREFNQEEKIYFADQLRGRELDIILWFARFDPISGTFCAEGRHTMTSADRKLLARICLEEKLNYAQSYYKAMYQSTVGLEGRLNLCKRAVDEYLIENLRVPLHA